MAVHETERAAVEQAIVAHYGGDGSVLDRITAALEAAGLDPDRLAPHVLAGVDEFHLGGRAATEALIADLELTATSRVIDVGCGIGGAARTMAGTVGCSVVGVDLTPGFVEAAVVLSDRTGLADQTTFRVGSALALDADADSFDAATLLHVGMNIEDKSTLMAELGRVVRPGGSVAVYDVMRVGHGEIAYPVPWAADASASFVAAPDEYRSAMRDAGLEPGQPTSRGALVASATEAAAASPPPVDLRTLVGPDFSARFSNLRAALRAGAVAPVQIIGRKV